MIDIHEVFGDFDEPKTKITKDTIGLDKLSKTFIDLQPNEKTGTDYLRASGLYDVCPREFVLNYWHPQPNKSFDFVSYLRMDAGTATHAYLQNKVLGPMGVLYGNWHCTIPMDMDGFAYAGEGFYPREQPVGTYEYVEPTVQDEKYRILGHIDGILSINRIKWAITNIKKFKTPLVFSKLIHGVTEQDLCLLEIKTVSKYQFDKVTNEKEIPEYYQMQTCIYQELKKIYVTLFWYLCRDDYSSKFIFYRYNKGWWDQAKKKAQIIWEAVRDRTLPESFRKCNLPTDKRAKNCIHCEDCFNRETAKNFEKWTRKQEGRQPNRKFLDLSELRYE